MTANYTAGGMTNSRVVQDVKGPKLVPVENGKIRVNLIQTDKAAHRPEPGGVE